MASEDVTITYTCTLLAEFEIVSRLPHGVAVEPHLKCLPRPSIPRILTMIRTVALVPPRMLSGSIVRSPAIPPAFEEVTGERAIVPPHPQFLGAYGAALIVLYGAGLAHRSDLPPLADTPHASAFHCPPGNRRLPAGKTEARSMGTWAR